MKTAPSLPVRLPYLIQSGRASWHQAKAGHAFSGSITADYTPDELAQYLAHCEARNEPHHVTRLPGPAVPVSISDASRKF